MDDVSQRILKKLSMDEKKKQGIFFTPSSEALALFNMIPIKPTSILEPSCGSGSFMKILPKQITTGIELNTTIFNEIKPIYKNVINMDFLKYNTKNKHDLIIGNPPYFTTTRSYESDLLYGRNNMYILFMIHSMNLLKEHGIIAFIIPTNFMNSSYYNKLRKEIYTNWTIHRFVQYDDIFQETKQKVFGIIIQKSKPKPKQNKKFAFIQNDNYYFVFSKKNLPTVKYSTLDNIGYEVKVGSVQWDANKHLFTNDDKATKLVYSSDITNNGVVFQEQKKSFRFIQNTKSVKGPIIILNRGYGNAKYELKATLFDPSYAFQLENHVLYIQHKNNNPNKSVLRKIERSLRSKETQQFIDTIFMNNGINSYELQNIIPLYL